MRLSEMDKNKIIFNNKVFINANPAATVGDLLKYIHEASEQCGELQDYEGHVADYVENDTEELPKEFRWWLGDDPLERYVDPQSTFVEMCDPLNEDVDLINWLAEEVGLDFKVADLPQPE